MALDEALKIHVLAEEAIRLLRNALGRTRKFKSAEFGHMCETVCEISDLPVGVDNLKREMRKCMRRLKRGKVKSFAKPVLGVAPGCCRIVDQESGIHMWLARGVCETVTLRVFIN